jgi:hypothetical protein
MNGSKGFGAERAAIAGLLLVNVVVVLVGLRPENRAAS